jgi:hypothetical protein
MEACHCLRRIPDRERGASTARDLLVNALFNSEAAGHPVVLTVHDEDVNEVPDCDGEREACLSR